MLALRAIRSGSTVCRLFNGDCALSLENKTNRKTHKAFFKYVTVLKFYYSSNCIYYTFFYNKRKEERTYKDLNICRKFLIVNLKAKKYTKYFFVRNVRISNLIVLSMLKSIHTWGPTSQKLFKSNTKGRFDHHCIIGFSFYKVYTLRSPRGKRDL